MVRTNSDGRTPIHRTKNVTTMSRLLASGLDKKYCYDCQFVLWSVFDILVLNTLWPFKEKLALRMGLFSDGWLGKS